MIRVPVSDDAPRCRWCVEPEAPGDWALSGACRGLPQDLFFVDRVGPGYKKGKQICAQCKVLDDCREFGLRVQPEYGLWGGLSPDERTAVAARMGA